MELNALLDGKGPFSTDFDHEPDPLQLDAVPKAEAADPEEAELEPGADRHSDDALKLYLREVQKTKPLTEAEEMELAVRIELGDKSARDSMIVGHLRLVVIIARRYLNRGLPFVDLIGEGNIGLLKAVERFRLSKECRLSTYATWWIRQGIERAIMSQSHTLRLPEHVSVAIAKMLQTVRQLAHKLNREPTTNELADALDLEEALVCQHMVLLKSTYSLERPMKEDDDYCLSDTLEDLSTISQDTLCEDLGSYEMAMVWMETLSQREKQVLMFRFGLNDHAPQTLDVLGKSLGLTCERVRQIESSALAKLREKSARTVTGSTRGRRT
jgi:RNA polymerase primary sigma factor